MKIVLNYRKGNPRLAEGIETAGHEVRENLWDIKSIVSEGVDAVIFEFKYIFKEKCKTLLLMHKLRQNKIPSITWNLDSPWNAGIERWKVNLLIRSSVLPIYATHSLQDTAWIRNTRVTYLPNAAWLSRYNLHGASLVALRDTGRYKWDVSFIGNIDKERFKEHKGRVEFLDALGGFLRNKGLNFLFIDGKDASIDKQVDIIQKSRINLSCLTASDTMMSKSWGLPERCYGIPACGGFLLMEDRVHAKGDFIVGEEVITYADIKDCLNKILHYLDKHDERRKIAEKAHQRVMREHTYKNRAEKLISEIRNLKDNVDTKTD